MSITRALPVIVAALMLTANAASAAEAPATADAVKANCEKEFGADTAKVNECIAKAEVAK